MPFQFSEKLLISCNLDMEMFLTLDATTDELLAGAQKLLLVIERLELFNLSKEKSCG